ncbi:MAG: MBL fold metallo-hydrolase [bacterium]|nr:MBL fold metallo-hydrolase [bacterium]
MNTAAALFFLALVTVPVMVFADNPLEKDIFKTSGGDLGITFIGHGTLMMTFAGRVIHVDPYSKLTDYNRLPDADLILITHGHGDHLDMKAIEAIRTKTTVIVANPAAAESLSGARVMENGQKLTVLDLPIEAVPAYNVVHKRDNDEPFHPPGRDNGYLVSFGDKRVYIAGDTENIDDMRSLGPVDIAFLPVNLPYTMTPEMFANAARMVRPKILYPYHYGDTDMKKLLQLLADESDIEVRVRSMK